MVTRMGRIGVKRRQTRAGDGCDSQKNIWSPDLPSFPK